MDRKVPNNDSGELSVIDWSLGVAASPDSGWPQITHDGLQTTGNAQSAERP